MNTRIKLIGLVALLLWTAAGSAVRAQDCNDAPDGLDCLGRMYWTNSNKIHRSTLAGSGVEDLLRGLTLPRAIAVDSAAGKMYWLEGTVDAIRRANLDGSQVEDLVTTGLFAIEGLALDTMANKMYWTDRALDKIQRADLDGSDVEDIINTGLGSTFDIALDLTAGKIYWTDAETGKIRRASLNGSDVEDVVTGLVSPYGIAVDSTAGKMYWTDRDADKIQRADLDGSNVEDLITSGLDLPRGLAVDSAAGKIYWVDAGTDKVQRSNLDGSGVEDLVTEGQPSPRFIALTVPDCNNNGIHDADDVANCAPSAHFCADCNNNGLPDECDLEFEFEAITIGSVYSGNSIVAADVDMDGDLDVLSASYFNNTIAWYENADGAGTFGRQQVIFNSTQSPQSVFAIDLDGDVDPDVLAASSYFDIVFWFENTDGAGTFGPQQIISSATTGACSVFSTDLDGDGDNDVLSASSFDDKIAWYENTDGAGTFGSQQVITTAADQAEFVFAADLDGDGDADVLSASSGDHKIAWYENTDGAGTFGLQQVITTAAESARSVYAVDLDGDWDNDVLSASFDDDKIAWYENIDGAGTFGAQQVISLAADRPRSVYAADVDNDGDADALSASATDDKIAWYENIDGAGTFGPQQVISTATNNGYAVTAADVDGDGDADVLAASAAGFYWFEFHSNDCNGNQMPDPCELADNDCNANGILDECDLRARDCNNNGIVDECETAANDCNANGVPDVCEPQAYDLAVFVGQLLAEVPDPALACLFDLDGSGAVDGNDIDDFVRLALALNDCNANGLPDEIDPEATDVALFVNQLLAATPNPVFVCFFDLDNSGTLDGDDIDDFVQVVLGL